MLNTKKVLTELAGHLHHLTSLSAQSTTFKKVHKGFQLSFHKIPELFIPKWFSHQSRITSKICNSKGYQNFSYNQNNYCSAKVIAQRAFESCHLDL